MMTLTFILSLAGRAVPNVSACIQSRSRILNRSQNSSLHKDFSLSPSSISLTGELCVTSAHAFRAEAES